jgi:hypothetical protein
MGCSSAVKVPCATEGSVASRLSASARSRAVKIISPLSEYLPPIFALPEALIELSISFYSCDKNTAHPIRKKIQPQNTTIV